MLCEVHALSVSTRKRVLLQDVSMHIEKGKIYGLIGNNGAGKTTLLKAIAGLIRIDKGTITFSKENVKIGYDIGDYTEIVGMSGRHVLSYYARLCDCYTGEYIDSLMEEVGLTEHAGERFGKYSVGMKQRLYFAIAILGNPDLLLLDEPTSGIDYAANIRIKEMIIQMKERDRVSAVISSHALEHLYEISDFFIFLREGKMVSKISKNELLARNSMPSDASYDKVRDIFSGFILESEERHENSTG